MVELEWQDDLSVFEPHAIGNVYQPPFTMANHARDGGLPPTGQTVERKVALSRCERSVGDRPGELVRATEIVRKDRGRRLLPPAGACGDTPRDDGNRSARQDQLDGKRKHARNVAE